MKYAITLPCLVLVLFSQSFLPGCQTAPRENARISRAEAERTALTRVRGGQIREAELEKEHGRLVWSMDIARPGTRNLTEIHVDAQTGAIVAEEVETPEMEAREAREERPRRQ